MPSKDDNCCVKTLKWLPVLFVLAMLSWSYYAYVYEFCLLGLRSAPTRTAFLAVHHVLFLATLWSYLRTVFAETGAVPGEFRLPPVEYELLECADTFAMRRQILERCSAGLPVTNRTSHGTIRYCERCRLIKPDRAHHCSVCGKCVLKMDHHCPWINNCVGFTNYKCFVLFLAYTFLYCLFVSVTTFDYFLAYWNEPASGRGSFHVLLVFVVSLMFAISLTSLLVYHAYLVAANRTTLESFRAPFFESGPDKGGYDLGACDNFREVFGDEPCLWPVPANTSRGDGVEFPGKRGARSLKG